MSKYLQPKSEIVVMTLQHVQPIVAESLAQWHKMIEHKETSILVELLHPEVVFRSPMAHRPYAGAFAVGLILQTVITIFENFTYHRSFATDDGMEIVLEFSAVVDGKSLKGIDMIRFNQEGKIIDFEVMIRPFNALAALGKAMGERVAGQVAAHKVG